MRSQPVFVQPTGCWSWFAIAQEVERVVPFQFEAVRLVYPTKLVDYCNPMDGEEWEFMPDLIELSEAYRFCPRCGTSRQSAEAARPFRCHGCGYTMFFGPVTAVGGLIFNDVGHVLLIERARDPGKGMLGMPGGFVDPNESAEDSLHREVYEEVRLKIADVKYLTSGPNQYTFQGVTSPVLDIFYQARVDGVQEINASASEVSHWFWSPVNNTVLSRMAFDSNRRALEFYLQQISRND